MVKSFNTLLLAAPPLLQWGGRSHILLLLTTNSSRGHTEMLTSNIQSLKQQKTKNLIGQFYQMSHIYTSVHKRVELVKHHESCFQGCEGTSLRKFLTQSHAAMKEMDATVCVSGRGGCYVRFLINLCLSQTVWVGIQTICFEFCLKAYSTA